MKLFRLPLLFLFAFSLTALCLRAEEPQKQAPATKPATKPATRPAPKDEPTVPSIKENPNDPRAKEGFLNRHEGFLKNKEKLLEKGPIQFLLVGDSITDGWRGGGKKKFHSAFDQYNPYNIGIGGDRTQHVLWRLEHGEVDGIQPKVAMLMIGTNNLGGSGDAEIAAGVTKCVQTLRAKLPDTKVLLLGIFPRAMNPDDKARFRIKNINESIKQLDDDGKTVKYLDIGDKFLEPDGTLPKSIMPDALHPNEKA